MRAGGIGPDPMLANPDRDDVLGRGWLETEARSLSSLVSMLISCSLCDMAPPERVCTPPTTTHMPSRQHGCCSPSCGNKVDD